MLFSRSDIKNLILIKTFTIKWFMSFLFRTMSLIIMVFFLFTICVLLLNILIAQLSDTYQNVQQDAQRGLEVNRAWIVSRVELNSLYIGKVKIFDIFLWLIDWLINVSHHIGSISIIQRRTLLWKYGQFDFLWQ